MILPASNGVGLFNNPPPYWANNRFLAILYDVTQETISKWISTLKKENLIRIEIDKSAGNRRKILIIHPIDDNVDTPS